MVLKDFHSNSNEMRRKICGLSDLGRHGVEKGWLCGYLHEFALQIGDRGIRREEEDHGHIF